MARSRMRRLWSGCCWLRIRSPQDRTRTLPQNSRSVDRIRESPYPLGIFLISWVSGTCHYEIVLITRGQLTRGKSAANTVRGLFLSTGLGAAPSVKVLLLLAVPSQPQYKHR